MNEIPGPEQQPTSPEDQLNKEIDEALENTTWNSPGLTAVSDLITYIQEFTEIQADETRNAKELKPINETIRKHKLAIPDFGNRFSQLWNTYRKTVSSLDIQKKYEFVKSNQDKVDAITDRPATSTNPPQQ